MTHFDLNHAQLVARIDNLVCNIIKHHSSLTTDQITCELNCLYEAFCSVYDDDRYRYTPTVEWFLASCFVVSGQYSQREFVWDKKATMEFIKLITQYANNYLKLTHDFALQEQRNSKSLHDYISHFLNKYARVLIVRVDLKIQVIHAQQVDVDLFHKYLQELLREIGYKRGCFEHLRGYTWAIEQGSDTGGLHCHLLLIYNGDKRQNDWWLADEVGKLWKSITNGLGIYYNCNTNDSKRSYANKGLLGVGMIRKDDSIAVNNAINTALYLTRPCKFGQRLKLHPNNMRSFGKGQL